MLYLPPDYAHDGIAVDECVTCSIGFRAPTTQELAQAFLDHLHDTIELSGRYHDPDLAPSRSPGAIGAAMTAQVAEMLGNIRWRRRDVARFLGCYLTEPKAHVVFDRPRAPLSPARFLARVRREGVVLALGSRMLFDRRHLYVNGEIHVISGAAASSLRTLANDGRLPPRSQLGAEVARLLYEWYRAGYVELPPAGQEEEADRPCRTK